jgi:radical SAM superfamily enzyme YgiQ (UPF0313 family)
MHAIFLNGGIIYAPLLTRSIGPYKLAHWIRKHGYTAKVIDHVTYHSEDQLYKCIQRFISGDTRIISLSTTFVCNNGYKHRDGRVRRIPEPVVNVLKTIKAQHPSIRFIMGGYMSDKLPSWDIFDATIMSYIDASEDIFLDFLDHLVNGGPEPTSVKQKTTIGAEPEERIIYNSSINKRYCIEHDDFRFEKIDTILPGEPLPLDVSRGCIFACRFCQYPHLGKKKLDYVRGMEYIKDEIVHNKESFNTNSYYILDDTFNDTQWKVSSFHKISQDLSFTITWAGYLRADLIHRFPDTAYQISESGCIGAYHGIESLNPYASKLVGKAWSGRHAKEFLPRLFHDTWKGTVAQHLNFIVGLPGETKNDIFDTARWFKENNLHSINFDLLTLYGPENDRSKSSILSEFDKNAEKYGFSFDTEFTQITDQHMRWKNSTWTVEEADLVCKEVTETIRKYRRTRTWTIIPLLWYGYQYNYLLSVPQVALPWKEIEMKTKTLFAEYHKLCMAY